MLKIKCRYIMIFLLLLFTAAALKLTYISSGIDAKTVENTYAGTKITVDRPRGTIFDRNGERISNDTEVYRAVITSEPQMISAIYTYFSKNEADKIADKLREGKPIVIDVPKDFKCENALIFRCFETNSHNPFAFHTLGYTDESGHGISGIQQAFDKYLFCESDSFVRFDCDALGRVLNTSNGEINLFDRDYQKGIVTTIDRNIQQICDNQNIKQGAIIICDCDTGEILGLSSFPHLSPDSLSNAIDDPLCPMINRCFASYNLGSIFKITVVAAALEKGIPIDRTYNCTGKIDCGTTFNCHKKEGHGKIDMQTALMNSCNTYFIDLALEVGAEAIFNIAERFGLNSTQTLCDYFEYASSLPKLKSLNSNGAIANFGIGQGDIMVSPLSVLMMTCAVANGGYLLQPEIILGTKDSDGEFTAYKTTAKKEKIISDSIAEKLKNMLIQTVSAGTGQSGKPTLGTAGGKTATAETGIKNSDGSFVKQAWFTGFYSLSGKNYAITVFCENSSSGSTDAAPVFKSICNSIALIT